VAPGRDAVAAAFDTAYRATFGRLLDGGVRRILNLRSEIVGVRPKFDLSTLAPRTDGAAQPKSVRQVHFTDRWEDTAIYNRLDLPVGAKIVGPAILEQPDTTVLIEPGMTGRVDRFGNTVIEFGKATG